MTPSPEALPCCETCQFWSSPYVASDGKRYGYCSGLSDMILGHDPIDSLLTEPAFGCMRHTALAPHRERVRRLVEAAREARKRLAGHAYIEADPRQLIQTRDRASDDVKRIHANLDAALAPFLEQETTP